MPHPTQPAWAKGFASNLVLVSLLCWLTACSLSPTSKADPLPKADALSIVPTHGHADRADRAAKQVHKDDTVTIDQTQEGEIGLKVEPAKRKIIIKTVEAPGRVGPNAELSRLVSTPSAGRATEVKSRLGDVVKEGQIMAIIKSDPIGQVQSDLLQNVLQAKADIKQQEVGLKLDRLTFERESILFKEQVSAKMDLQAAENAVEKDEANLVALKAKMDAYIKVAQERLSLLGAPPDSAKKVLSQDRIDPWVVIRAPASGLVIERAINPGEMNDGSKQLFTITDLSQVWLFADIFEKDIRDINKGDEAVVTIDSLPGRSFPAKIIWVGDSVNTTTRTLPVRANVANLSSLLRPGMFARIKINAAQIAVIKVPHSAVIQKGDKVFVYVDVGNRTFAARDVVVGTEDPAGVEIKSGLKLGEPVVIRGGTALLGTAMKSLEGKD